MLKQATAILKILLTDFNLSKEFLADKFKVRTITIERWANGETQPSYVELKYLNRIYNGYKTKKGI